MARQTFDDAMPAWRPEAIVFDVDGLLVDTEPCWTVAETELFRRRGRPFGDEEKALLIGRSLAAAALTLADEFDEPGNEELRSSAPPRRGRCTMPPPTTTPPRGCDPRPLRGGAAAHCAPFSAGCLGVAILGPSEEGPLPNHNQGRRRAMTVAILGPSEEGPLRPAATVRATKVRVAILGPSEEGPLRCDRRGDGCRGRVAILGPSEEGPLPTASRLAVSSRPSCDPRPLRGGAAAVRRRV